MVDIDKMRMDKRFLAHLASKEEVTTDLPQDCYRCAYRDKEVNMCWYTVATHKLHKVNNKKCEHFVDENKLNM